MLAAWAGLFWFLWVSGREAFYLSTRTDWIVPIAAVLLTAATDRPARVGPRGRAQAARRARALDHGADGGAGACWCCSRRSATLGTFSAGKRSAFSGAGFAASAGDIGSGELTLIDVAAAETSPEGEKRARERGPARP